MSQSLSPLPSALLFLLQACSSLKSGLKAPPLTSHCPVNLLSQLQKRSSTGAHREPGSGCQCPLTSENLQVSGYKPHSFLFVIPEALILHLTVSTPVRVSILYRWCPSSIPVAVQSNPTASLSLSGSCSSITAPCRHTEPIQAASRLQRECL